MRASWRDVDYPTQSDADLVAQSDDEDAPLPKDAFFSSAFTDALRGAMTRGPPAEAAPDSNQLIASNNAFGQALKDALQRQKSMLSASRPRGMDDDDGAPGKYDPLYSPDHAVPRAAVELTKARATPYVPPPPKPKEMSELGEVIAQAWAISRLNVQRLNRIKMEIDNAIEREKSQMERLEFAMNKAESDAAFYRTTERQLKKEREQNSGGSNGNGVRSASAARSGSVSRGAVSSPSAPRSGSAARDWRNQS